MLQKKAISEISTDSPDTQDFWRVASSNRIKTTERPHRRSLLSHAHSAEYRQKMRLRVQDRSDLQNAYFHLLIHPDSRKYLRFAFEKQGISCE